MERPLTAELRTQTICLAILTGMAVAAALWWLRPVMIPFVVAGFLAITLMPMVDRLEKYARLPRTLAVCVAVFLALAVLVALGAIVAVSAAQIASNAGEYQLRVEQLLERAANALPLDQLNIDPDIAVNPFKRIPYGNILQRALTSVTGIITESVVVLVFLFFLLLSSVKRDQPVGGAWGEMEDRIRAYLVTTTVLSGICGILSWVVLWYVGVQSAIVFGLLTFLLLFIPNVGSFISIVLPLPLLLLGDFSTSEIILAIGLPGVSHFMLGNFLQPKLLGDSMQLHPVVILMSLIFWGMLWGIVGMFLAVPITASIRIAFDRHPLTRPVADVMAGRLDSLRNEPAAG